MKPLAAIALVVMLSVPLSVHAQSSQRYSEAEQWSLNGRQVKEALQSPIAEVRAQTLRNAIIFATLYRERADLSAAVDAIRAVYENDVLPSNQKLALAALQAIGRTDVLARVTPEESAEGRQMMMDVLNDYHAGRAAMPGG